MIEATTKRFGQKGDVAAAALKLELQKDAWDAVGPARTEAGIAAFGGLIDRLTARLDDVAIPNYATFNQSFIEFEELRNLLETAKAVAAAALERDASLGGHVRLDKGEISVLPHPIRRLCTETLTDTAYAGRAAENTAQTAPRLQGGGRLAPLTVKVVPLSARRSKDKAEARYQTIMGSPEGAAPEVEPGSDDAAVAEKRAA